VEENFDSYQTLSSRHNYRVQPITLNRDMQSRIPEGRSPKMQTPPLKGRVLKKQIVDRRLGPIKPRGPQHARF
jgi:hypothetical protein